MKKILSTLAFVIAMCGATYANDADVLRCNNDSVVVSEQTIELLQNVAEAGNVISFYEIDRIKITNPQHTLIQIYDCNWKLVYKTTNENIDLLLQPGNYHIVSNAPIKKHFIA